jgi:hypothetical protein
LSCLICVSSIDNVSSSMSIAKRAASGTRLRPSRAWPTSAAAGRPGNRKRLTGRDRHPQSCFLKPVQGDCEIKIGFAGASDERIQLAVIQDPPPPREIGGRGSCRLHNLISILRQILAWHEHRRLFIVGSDSTAGQRDGNRQRTQADPKANDSWPCKATSPKVHQDLLY